MAAAGQQVQGRARQNGGQAPAVGGRHQRVLRPVHYQYLHPPEHSAPEAAPQASSRLHITRGNTQVVHA